MFYIFSKRQLFILKVYAIKKKYLQNILFCFSPFSLSNNFFSYTKCFTLVEIDGFLLGKWLV